MTLAARISALVTVIVADINALDNRAQNFEVEDVENGDSFTHSMNSTKLEVTFYGTDGVLRNDIAWEPNGLNAIYVYLPLPESGSAIFDGDIYIKKRA